MVVTFRVNCKLLIFVFTYDCAASERTSAKIKSSAPAAMWVSNIAQGGGEKLVHKSCAACGAASERTSAC